MELGHFSGRNEWKNSNLINIRHQPNTNRVHQIELATGKFPYGVCKSEYELLAKIVQDEAPILTPQQGFSAPFCNFVVACLSKNVADRPKYPELLVS